MIMHQEFANISKNKLSSKDAQKFIHQKVNKTEILELYMKQQANTELEDKLKRYKRGQSMGELTNGRRVKKKPRPMIDTVAVPGRSFSNNEVHQMMGEGTILGIPSNT
jgi:hypothetical protein